MRHACHGDKNHSADDVEATHKESIRVRSLILFRVWFVRVFSRGFLREFLGFYVGVCFWVFLLLQEAFARIRVVHDVHGSTIAEEERKREMPSYTM